jgi:hypothetical protein
MTRERIADGLELLCLQLGNGQTDAMPPEGWTSHEWAYVKGLATGAVMQFRYQLIAAGNR